MINESILFSIVLMFVALYLINSTSYNVKSYNGNLFSNLEYYYFGFTQRPLSNVREK